MCASIVMAGLGPIGIRISFREEKGFVVFAFA